MKSHPRKKQRFKRKDTPDHFAEEIKTLAANTRFEIGRLSSGQVIRLSGVTRVEFLTMIGNYRVSPFAMTLKKNKENAVNMYRYLLNQL